MGKYSIQITGEYDRQVLLLEIGCEPETIEVIIQDIFYTVLEEYKLLSKTRKANETNETT